MQRMGVRRAGLSAAGALILATVLVAPATATTGWLDPAFSGNGWVRLDEPVGPFVGGQTLVVAPGPSGQTMLGRQITDDGAPNVQALVLGASGSPLSTFNDGRWDYFIGATDAAAFAGLFPTQAGGVIGVQGLDMFHTLRLRELGPGGSIIRSLSPGFDGQALLSANVVRLPGGSLRICYSDDIEHILVGYTPAFQLDLGVGPGGRRAVPMQCSAVGADTAGHLYLGLGFQETLNGTIRIVRTTTSGIVDTVWSGDGQTTVARPGLGFAFADESVSGGPGFATAASPILNVADGSVFLAARVTRDGMTWSAAVIKLTANGSLDPAFDGDGIRTFGPSDGQSRILAMAVDGAGRPVVSAVYETPGGRKAYLARLTSGGRFDPAFGHGGLIQQSFGATGVAIDASGRILTAAWDGTDVIVARRNG